MSVMIQASPKDALGNLYNLKSEGEEPEVVWADFGAFLTLVGGVELAQAVRETLVTSLSAKAPARPDPTPAAVQTVQAAMPGSQVISQPDPWGHPPVPPMVPAAAGQQTSVPAPQPAGVPTCQHGPKTYKSGVTNGRQWAFWGCNARSDDPTKCAKEWA